MAILNVFWKNDFQLGLFACIQPAGIRQVLPKLLKITSVLSSINCYEVKALKIFNGSVANMLICHSSINGPSFAAIENKDITDVSTVLSHIPSVLIF